MAIGFRYCVRAGLFGAAIVLPLVVVGGWLVDPFVRLLLPKYVDCIPISRWLFWLALVPVLDLPRQLLIVAKKTREYGFSVLASFGVFAAILFGSAALKHPLPLLDIVVVSVVCKIGATLLGALLAWFGARREIRMGIGA